MAITAHTNYPLLLFILNKKKVRNLLCAKWFSPGKSYWIPLFRPGNVNTFMDFHGVATQHIFPKIALIITLKYEPNPVSLVNDSGQPVYSPVERAPLDFALVFSRNQG